MTSTPRSSSRPEAWSGPSNLRPALQEGETPIEDWCSGRPKVIRPLRRCIRGRPTSADATCWAGSSMNTASRPEFSVPDGRSHAGRPTAPGVRGSGPEDTGVAALRPPRGNPQASSCLPRLSRSGHRLGRSFLSSAAAADDHPRVHDHHQKRRAHDCHSQPSAAAAHIGRWPPFCLASATGSGPSRTMDGRRRHSGPRRCCMRRRALCLRRSTR